jgi:hypothetical protein
MKLNKQIEINILDFLKYGKFDYIKLGQTKEWILNNFPDPDDYSKNIFKYGDIEFHFKDGILFLIFSEYFSNLKLDGGKNINIINWIFNTLNELTLINIIKLLNENGINYTKKEQEWFIELKLERGVKIIFDKIENLNKNNYIMTSIGLIDDENIINKK